MSIKRSRILRIITRMLAIGLVYVLIASPGIAQANDKNQSLIQAVQEGRLEEVTRLLNSGADANAKDNGGRTGSESCNAGRPPENRRTPESPRSEGIAPIPVAH